MTEGSAGHVQFPAAEPIVSACRLATARSSGVHVLDAEVTPAGVQVRLSSRPRQQEALAALLLLGYQVAGDSRGGGHGAALVVAGWDAGLLAERVARLENAGRWFDRGARDLAAGAISRFTELEGTRRLSEASARERAASEAGQVAQDPYPDGRHVSAPVAGEDLLRAAGETQALLSRASRGEDAAAAAGARAQQLADTAIRLFTSYRDSIGEERAAERAALEAVRDERPAGVPPGGMLPWQPGDVVLSADLRLFMRAREGCNGDGRWPWCEGVGYVPVNELRAPEGDTEDSDVIRPVTLLIRSGRALGGVVIDDRTLRGALVQDGLPAPGEPAGQ